MSHPVSISEIVISEAEHLRTRIDVAQVECLKALRSDGAARKQYHLERILAVLNWVDVRTLRDQWPGGADWEQGARFNE